MISIITVNYKNTDDTLSLLQSLVRQERGGWDIIAIDNASGDDDRARLGAFVASSDMSVELVVNSRNLGFSGGNNVGIKRALSHGAEWVVLLNNDCVVPDGWLTGLSRQLNGTAPGVYSLPVSEGERVAWCGRVSWLSSTLPHVYGRDDAERLLEYGKGYAIGAAMVVHRDILRDVGPLDERYFLYFEDAAYSCRTRSVGYPVCLLDVPPVEHGVSRSTRTLGNPLLLRYHARNMLLFNKDFGPWWARFSLPILAFLRILTQLGRLFVTPSRSRHSRAIIAGIIDFYANRFGHIPEDRRPGVRGS